jgi:hypothetical protein
MKTILRIALPALAIAGFVTVETPSQAMPVQTALVEFGRDKDGVRFDVTGRRDSRTILPRCSFA